MKKVEGFRFQVLGFGLLVLAGLLVPGIAGAASNAKNVYDVRFESLRPDYEKLVTADAASWDFNFRAYGNTGELVSDPAIVRDVSQGKTVKGQPTAVRVSCDEDGWSFLVFCAEPEASERLAAGEALPMPRMELYFMEGDTDNENPPFYWQFYKNGLRFEQYDWPVNDRRWRFLKPYVRQGERRVANGYVFRMDIPWEGLWDRLPIFSDRMDNFWRLQVIRWAGAGGQTWGGGVHEPSRAGFIRWPAFTDAQKTEIMRRLLEKAWSQFNVLMDSSEFSVKATGPSYDLNTGYVRTEPYAVARVKREGPRTYVNYCEDPAFRPTLERLVAAAKAYGKGIAEFGKMDTAAQAAFYREASEALFNFRYTVEEAYAKALRTKFTKEGK